MREIVFHLFICLSTTNQEIQIIASSKKKLQNTVHFKIAPSKNVFQNCDPKTMSINKKKFLQTRRVYHDFLYHFPLRLDL